MKVELENENQLPPLKVGDYVHYIPEKGWK